MTWSKWEKVSGLEFEDIIYEKKRNNELGGRVARITINRPQTLNAVTGRTQDEIWESVDDASRDTTVGVVVLTGAGNKAFCVGGDVKWEEKGGTRRILYGGYPTFNEHVRRCKKPTIAAVKGYAIGGGNHLAYCCDLTIAADNAVFGQNGPRVGSPADGWIVAYLLRVVGAKKAKEIWLTCRKYNAQEALRMGLVNNVVPLDELDEEVDKLSEEILSLSPTCIEILKATFDSEFDYFRSSMGSISKFMAPDFIDSAECKEAQQAFFEKRKPNFWQFRSPQADKR